MASATLPRVSLPITFRFDNAFVRELPGDVGTDTRPRQVHGAAYSRVEPTPVAGPRVLAHSPEMAATLGFSEATVRSAAFAAVFGGNALLEGMEPYAANYGGHQFGHWAGQLGDGRAITLGEGRDAQGRRWELQLKGAGRTPYSRTADGRAVMRSSIREFLCSEAMHHLGVPTTRALSLVATGDEVLRDMFYDGRPQLEPGAIVCRVAPSFVRFGTFELPASRQDVELLNALIALTIRRDFPELPGDGAVGPDVHAEWFSQVCERTARMVAEWMRVGFVHGVMNTDNMSILGLTIDYGPYGWIDHFDPEWTPNTTDAGGRRYRFGHQAQIAHWNLRRLASALHVAWGTPEPLQAGLERYVTEFNRVSALNVAAKLGLRECLDEDVERMNALYALLHEGEIDMTIFFRQLADVQLDRPSLEPLGEAFYDATKRQAVEPRLMAWLSDYASRVARDLPWPDRRARMHGANPRYVLRNYLAQQAIDRAEAGDATAVTELLDVLRHPYDEQSGAERFAERRPDWARDRPGCSMLSCSS
jgi:uncharacterized protein YdiU (UPF0061 family)